MPRQVVRGMSRQGLPPQVVTDGLAQDGENTMRAMSEALRTADHVRDIRRRVSE